MCASLLHDGQDLIDSEGFLTLQMLKENVLFNPCFSTGLPETGTFKREKAYLAHNIEISSPISGSPISLASVMVANGKGRAPAQKNHVVTWEAEIADEPKVNL